MTIEEAIKIQEDYLGTGPEPEPVDFDKAIALGKEALKRTRQARVRKEPYWGALLPGETITE